jgi:hypothetical protein
MPLNTDESWSGSRSPGGGVPERRYVDRRRNLVDRKRQTLAPVRMFVDRARDVGLINHAKQILERDGKQA